jgi:uncharacterized protein YbjT (DUF2867 family)
VRILVTGATGHLGGRLVPRLLDRGGASSTLHYLIGALEVPADVHGSFDVGDRTC